MDHNDSTQTMSDHEKEVNDWIRFGLRLGVSAALHPLEYSKVLIQLGYEPIAPRPGTSILGKPIMFLPNIFQYAGYIRQMDGFFGMYRGLTPKLVGSIVGMLCSERIADKLGLPAEKNDESISDLTVDTKWQEGIVSDEELYIQFKTALKRDVVLSVSGLIVSHPFHVISVRMMAQFIGKESLYKSIFGSIKEIFRNDGIFGFFSGIVPKLLCDVACLVLTSSTVYMVSKYLVKDKMSRTYCAGGTQFIFASILYPLQVVSTCMVVTGSRLMAGRPPVMPEYDGWRDCWNDLQTRGELKRGSSVFWRYVNQPVSKRPGNNMAPLPILSKYY
ncbi:mitochondrial carrier homolog 2 [Eupeodes corollae]|uniref:mitochondrial carrier homolog 2 n=1 Tax=Eupeodes corollae TaxID=290404 RepID=UPI0024927283|nr:mitochondrial carrier homolog 2 [Eupeodes corollae]